MTALAASGDAATVHASAHPGHDAGRRSAVLALAVFAVAAQVAPAHAGHARARQGVRGLAARRKPAGLPRRRRPHGSPRRPRANHRRRPPPNAANRLASFGRRSASSRVTSSASEPSPARSCSCSAGLLALFGFVVGASFVGAEWSTGGMMNLLVWRPRRVRLLLGKLAALLLGVLRFVVVSGVAWLAALWTVSRFRGDASRADVRTSPHRSALDAAPGRSP